MKAPKYNAQRAKEGAEAEAFVAQWMRGNAYDVVRFPHGEDKEDLHCKHRTTDEAFYLEVERRNGWLTGPFPFPEANVPDRRRVKIRPDILLMTVCHDLTRGIIIFPNDVRTARKEIETNKVVEDEDIYKVGIWRCLPVDLTSHSTTTIAQQNQERVDAIMRNGTPDIQHKTLWYSPPYGVTTEQWERWRGPQYRTARQRTKQRGLFDK